MSATHKIQQPGIAPGVQPLPKDTSSQGLLPLSVTEGSGPPRRAEVDVVAEGNPVEEFLAEHPETDADRAAAVTPPDVPEPEAGPVDEPSVGTEGAPVNAKPGAAEPASAPEAKPGAEAQATTEAKPAEAKPAEAQVAKPTYGADEKFALGANADGTPVEWTRGQLVEALRERVNLAPLASETEKWRGLFNGDFAKAESDWKPLLATLRENPHLTQLFDNVLHDEALADYLQRSAIHFENERLQGNVPARQAQQNVPEPQLDRATAERIAKLEAKIAADERQRNLDRANQEIASAISQYPFLASDQAALRDLVTTADYLNAQNPAWGMREALAAKRSMYEAVTYARNAQTQQAPPAAAPAPVPALLGSGGGASPGGTRGVDNGRPKKFNDLTDATEAWIAQHPS